jgi:hypothetical protein
MDCCEAAKPNVSHFFAGKLSDRFPLGAVETTGESKPGYATV